jgi:hypothetical protein
VASRQLAACLAIAKQRLIEGISRSYSSFHTLLTNEKSENGQSEETENKFHHKEHKEHEGWTLKEKLWLLIFVSFVSLW